VCPNWMVPQARAHGFRNLLSLHVTPELSALRGRLGGVPLIFNPDGKTIGALKHPAWLGTLGSNPKDLVVGCCRIDAACSYGFGINPNCDFLSDEWHPFALVVHLVSHRVIPRELSGRLLAGPGSSGSHSRKRSLWLQVARETGSRTAPTAPRTRSSGRTSFSDPLLPGRWGS
jgi:hypothetical protein